MHTHYAEIIINFNSKCLKSNEEFCRGSHFSDQKSPLAATASTAELGAEKASSLLWKLKFPVRFLSSFRRRPSFQPSHSRCTFPGGPGGKEGEGGKGGDEGASGLSGILPDASGPPESARQRLPLSGLAWRARISFFQEPPTLVRESPQLQPLPHNAATAGEPVPSTCQQTRPRPAPHPRGAGSIPGLRGEGVRDRVASAPCRLSGDPKAAPVQTPVGPGRPCRWAGAEQRAGHRPRPARRGGDASGRLSPRRAPRDPSHSALGRPG